MFERIRIISVVQDLILWQVARKYITCITKLIGGKVMRRVFKKCVAVALAAAMVVTIAPADADAAKKPSLKKKASVKVGKTTTLKLKNGNKKAKVTWKSNKAKIAKITKQVKKGNKASAKVKGLKKGSAKITATYKLGKKTTKFTCKVTVKKNDGGSNTGTQTAAPTVAPTATATVAPAPATATPTKGPTATPRPTPTPTPRPKNANLDAYGLGKDADGNEAVITVDGVVDEAWEDSKSNDLLTAITKESGIRGGESSVTAATASIMWGSNAAYVLVDVKKANAGDADSVTIYFDENAKATADTVQKVTVKAGESGKSTKTNDGYIVEAKFDIAAAKEAGSAASIEIQINEGDVTTNYYDTRSAMVYNEETKAFELGDATVAVAEKPELMGQLSLLKSMAQSTLAYYTADGAELRAAAKIDEGTWDVPAAEGEDQTVTAKQVTFVDTKYWTDAYGDNAAIKFPNFNLSSTNGGTAYAPDGRGSNNVALMKQVVNDDGTITYEPDADLAKGYVIWDEDYLYVLFDIKDTDVTEASVDGAEAYLTDSTEFFLDEDNSKPSSYSAGGDEIQVRVAPANNSYTSEDVAKTGSYELVAHASQITEGVGYKVQYIIKLNNKHKAGDIMGMDLQVNDCETIEVEGTDDEGNPTTTKSSARACTITAYDTANEDYQNPSYFGRVKLINPNASSDNTPGDDTPGDDTPGTETGDKAIVFSADTAHADADTPDWYTSSANNVYNADGSVSFNLDTTSGANLAIGFFFDASKAAVDLSQYSKAEIVVATDAGDASIRAAVVTNNKLSMDPESELVAMQYATANPNGVTVSIPLGSAAAGKEGFGVAMQHCGWNTATKNPLFTIKSITLKK